MRLYLVDDFAGSEQRIIGRLNLVFPGLKELEFDGEFYRFRSKDLDYAFDGTVYAGAADNKYADFKETYVYDFFKSNNDDFWLTGTDIKSILTDGGIENIPQLFLSEITEEQGYSFGNKLIKAYNTEKDKHKNIPRGVPDSVVVFDAMIVPPYGAADYIKGMEKAESENSVKPNIYMFAGEMPKNQPSPGHYS